MRSTPITIAIPTEKATVIRRPTPYSVMDCSELGIIPPSAATSEASSATAVNAGSAIVVPNPKQNAKINNQNTLPFRAKACAIFSPMGNKPSSSPKIKNVRPKMTNNKPKRIETKLGKGSCRTTNWKKVITITIGRRSRALLNRARNKAVSASMQILPLTNKLLALKARPVR
ncbi:hypothetical protein [Vibrio parahaemolyticus RIMD 2210633]|uniref:Uncharacterized protein n=1 Tax=Vibrio parahaemolyticus serotype O3:K6 (strain RIMD 2210633) TaxID=223926 RepID=Q87RI4_VIBPA|nr:hypothetical protein [Vibrio parahaemolyticus RIMD 2210633]